jgi:hypothetical protein
MPDLAYLTISGRGQDQRVEIAEQDVAAMVNEFQAIGEDPGKFEAFVKRAALGGFKITPRAFLPSRSHRYMHERRISSGAAPIVRETGCCFDGRLSPWRQVVLSLF